MTRILTNTKTLELAHDLDALAVRIYKCKRRLQQRGDWTVSEQHQIGEMNARQRELQRKVSSAIQSRNPNAVTAAELEYASLVKDLFVFEYRIENDL